MNNRSELQKKSQIMINDSGFFYATSTQCSSIHTDDKEAYGVNTTLTLELTALFSITPMQLGFAAIILSVSAESATSRGALPLPLKTKRDQIAFA